MNLAHTIKKIRSWWSKHDSVSQLKGTKTTLQRAVEQELARLKREATGPGKQISPQEEVQAALFNAPLRSSIFQR